MSGAKLCADAEQQMGLKEEVESALRQEIKEVTAWHASSEETRDDVTPSAAEDRAEQGSRARSHV